MNYRNFRLALPDLSPVFGVRSGYTTDTFWDKIKKKKTLFAFL